MTAAEAICEADALQPNEYPNGIKEKWLSRLEDMIRNEIISTHEGSGDVGERDNSGGDTELLAPSPYDEMYVVYIMAQVHFNNGEYDRYNNAMAKFSSLYQDYADYYNRTFKPKGEKIHYFGGRK